ncbi:MAG: NAD(P)/FAD-dependent oxidoreductase [Atopobiaceae bacterium]|jgi:NADPH-dependent 2,4-dienoyl-CoA reductase/sulfur reductase-like enzyme/Fe2+ transport system protein FeoA
MSVIGQGFLAQKDVAHHVRAVDVVVVGGGPAGLAAAISAYEEGCRSVLILERDHELGGILNQCIHNGFGLHRFKEELTGPEYAERFVARVRELDIEYKLDTIVTDITPERLVCAMNRSEGMFFVQAGAIVLAMGCRERPRGALNIPGYRPAGIYTAGCAQRLVNLEGYMPGKEVVILGSGDIGLIMARRLTLEGAHVQVVAELLPYSGGLKRNIVQCLDDFGIPLLLSHTVVDIEGKDRVRAVSIAQVDERMRPIPGTEQRYECDTLLLSCGLIPENELSASAGVTLSPATKGPVVNESLETDVPGIFACGNVLHVHDLVDYVSEEAERAGKAAWAFARGEKDGAAACDASGAGAAAGGGASERMELIAQEGVRYTVPSFVDPACMDEELVVRFRVTGIFEGASICVYRDQELLLRRKRPIMVPGEMEQVVLKRKDLAGSGAKRIVVCIE